ncbi:peptide chain release factor N(5)-glutamine methyltransferase [Flavobacteriaceae bacterium]|nr:peptide chain release factor N(5)-glutamine methyltransferase [Flavobacteriaceae bacterium]|tara:strand:+ start:1587 stop:2429 length:843 start_codon:yes stop_codon:yes gene_type:complete
MKLKDLKKNFITKLAVIYPNEEISATFKILCKQYLNMSSAKLLLAGEELINKKQIDMFSNAIVRLLNEEPIQYILKTTTFYGLEFICTPSALIPRPETEELVDWIIKSETNEIKILDIGTGTGCISISLANRNGFVVDALDVSSSVLDLAKQNAKKNDIDINFIEADIFEYKSDKQYDLIVSNPPYIRNLEKNKMQNNVLNFEPRLALFVEDDDPLVFYNSILQFANSNLYEKGSVYFEINENFSKEMESLLYSYGFTEIELKKDSFGKNRFIRGLKSLH